jgi:hypothetical protein
LRSFPESGGGPTSSHASWATATAAWRERTGGTTRYRRAGPLDL